MCSRTCSGPSPDGGGAPPPPPWPSPGACRSSASSVDTCVGAVCSLSSAQPTSTTTLSRSCLRSPPTVDARGRLVLLAPLPSPDSAAGGRLLRSRRKRSAAPSSARCGRLHHSHCCQAQWPPSQPCVERQLSISTPPTSTDHHSAAPSSPSTAACMSSVSSCSCSMPRGAESTSSCEMRAASLLGDAPPPLPATACAAISGSDGSLRSSDAIE